MTRDTSSRHTASALMMITLAALLGSAATHAQSTCPADLNDDEVIDMHDVAIFQCSFGSGLVAPTLDPFPLVPHDPTLIDFVNPYPAWGDVIGVDAYNDGNELLVLWDNGNVGRYSGDFATEIDTFQTSLDLTDISAVPSTYGLGGTIAVTDSTGGVYFFKDDHTYVGGKGINGQILAFTWDAAYNRALVGNSNGLFAVDENGDLAQQLFVPPAPSSEAINMDPEYFDMVTGNAFFNQFNPDGTINFAAGGRGTSYGGGGSMKGMAFTRDFGYVAASGIVARYEKAPFQDHMSFEVPEPGSTYPGDLDQDGDVDFDDWSLFAPQIGITCP